MLKVFVVLYVYGFKLMNINEFLKSQNFRNGFEFENHGHELSRYEHDD